MAAYLLASSVHVGKRPKLNALTMRGPEYLKAVVMREDQSVWMKKDDFSCEESEMDIAEYDQSEDEITAEDSSSEGDLTSSVTGSEETEVPVQVPQQSPCTAEEDVTIVMRPSTSTVGSSSESDGAHCETQPHRIRLSSPSPRTPSLESACSGPSTIAVSPMTPEDTFCEGSRVSVLRSSGTWSQGTIQRISAYYTVKIDDNSVKLIPLSHADKYLKAIPDQPEKEPPENSWNCLMSQIEKVLRPKGSIGMKLPRVPGQPMLEVARKRAPKRHFINIS
eukprot:TRINITY_DN36767_c0_g1_i1.p1 TRINITY_DN36767_c0_g1~~TRINITY_DN36767_c0_g1_i1.p1  ORF type:complete len:278 (+),score=59.09 TRINITY_DN36767_c0_g1_i1:35-868(+)